MTILYWIFITALSLIGTAVTIVCLFSMSYNIRYHRPHPVLGPLIQMWVTKHHFKFSVAMVILFGITMILRNALTMSGSL